MLFHVLHYVETVYGGNVPCVSENVESAEILDCWFDHFEGWMVQYWKNKCYSNEFVFMVYVCFLISIELNTTVTHLYIDIDSRINPFQIEELRGCPAFEVL